MRVREDMKLYEYQASNGDIYQYRIPDSAIKTYDEGNHYVFHFSARNRDNANETIVIDFRLEGDFIDQAVEMTNKMIEKYILEKKHG